MSKVEDTFLQIVELFIELEAGSTGREAGSENVQVRGHRVVFKLMFVMELNTLLLFDLGLAGFLPELAPHRI